MIISRENWANDEEARVKESIAWEGKQEICMKTT